MRSRLHCKMQHDTNQLQMTFINSLAWYCYQAYQTTTMAIKRSGDKVAASILDLTKSLNNGLCLFSCNDDRVNKNNFQLIVKDADPAAKLLSDFTVRAKITHFYHQPIPA